MSLFFLHSSQLNPEKQTALVMDCLCTLKATVAVIHTSTYFRPDYLQQLQKPHLQEYLYSLLEIAISVTQDDSFLLDCRSASGLLVTSVLQSLLSDKLLLTTIIYLFGWKDCMKKSIFVSSEIFKRTSEIISKYWNLDCSSLVSQIIICHSCLSKLPSSLLHTDVSGIMDDKVENFERRKTDTGDPPQSLFCDIVLPRILQICHRIDEKSTTVYSFRTLCIWTNEAFNSCKLWAIEKQNEKLERFSADSLIMTSILETLQNNISHPIDAVRHQIKASVDKVFGIADLFENLEAALQKFVESALTGDFRNRGKCISLNCLLDYIDINSVLKFRPNLPTDLVESLDDFHVVSHVCDLYGKAAKRDRDQCEHFDQYKDSWISRWAEPVFKVVTTGESMAKSALVEYVLPSLLKTYPGLLFDVFEQTQKRAGAPPYIIAAISLFKTARGMKTFAEKKILESQQNVDDEKLWHGFIPVEYVRNCLSHIDDQVLLCSFLVYWK